MTRVESPGNHHRLRVWLGSPSKLQNLLKTQFAHLQDKMFPLGVGGGGYPVCVKALCGQACFWAFAHAVPSSRDTIHLNPPQHRRLHLTDSNNPSGCSFNVIPSLPA